MIKHTVAHDIHRVMERMVHKKRMILKSQDSYLAIMRYRVTSQPWCNLSPLDGKQDEDNYSAVEGVADTQLDIPAKISRKQQEVQRKPEEKLR